MRADQTFSYGRPCRDPDEPCRLTPIRFDPKRRWYFLRSDIDDAFGRAMFSMDLAIWTAQEDLDRLTPRERICHEPRQLPGVRTAHLRP